MRGFWPRVEMLRFALGVAFALAATALGGPTPAYANCQPDPISDGDTVNCAAAGGTQTTSVGTGSENNVTVNVQPGATIDVSGTPAEGIDLADGNTVTNAGTIIVDNGAAIAARDNNIITNTGRIIGGAGATGISVGNGNVVTNIGSIVLGDGGVGIQADDANVVTNLGTIITGDSGTGISVLNGNTVLNRGAIRIGNGAIGIDVCCDNNVTNSGSIVGLDGALGILAGDHSNVANSGSITVGTSGFGILADGDGLAAGVKATISNSGTITVGDFGRGMAALFNYNVINSGAIVASSGGVGILVDDGSVVVNTGTIRVGDFGAGIVAAGDNSTVNNSGAISGGAGAIGINVASPLFGFHTTGPAITNSGTVIVGAGGTGVNFEDNGTLTNTGLIRATGDGTGNGGYSVFTCDCTTTSITNYGTLDGKIQAEGVSTTFQNRGLITITDSDAVQPIGPFNFNISDFNGTGGGSFQQFAEGTLSLRIKPGAPAPIDSLLADTVILAGTLRVAIQPGLYANTTISDTAVSLTGNGAPNITTTFDRFVSSSPFFSVTPIYDSGDPTNWNFLTLQLDRIGFGSVPGMTPNQRAVGNALEGSYSTALTGNAATFYGNLLAATSVTVLDQLSGEGTSAAQTASFSAGSLFNNAMQNQALFGPNLNGIGALVPTAYAAERVAPGHEAFAALRPSPAAEPSRWRVWTAGFGASQSLQGSQTDPGSSSQSVRSAGGVLGVDWQAAWDLRVGIAVGGSESTFSVTNLATSGRMTAGHIGAYAMKTWGSYYAAASLSYARLDNSTTRTITGVGPTETVSGRFDSDLLSARLELGWKQAYGRVNVTPFVAVEPSVLWQRGYTESGNGILGLTVASHTATSLPTFVGVQFDGRYVMPDGAVLAPYSRVSWVHEFEPDRRVSAAFITIPGASFTVDGARAASDAARLDAGARLIFRGGLALFGTFTGEWSDHTHSYAGSGGLRYVW